jgi:hypothetical protein
MNFKGIKPKLLRFKRIFTTCWSIFVASHPRYNTDYYHSEVNKMLRCGSEENGFATYQCLGCGKGKHNVNFSCKGKACPQCGKRYARDSMVKIGTKLFPGVSYRQVVLTLPEQLRIPFHNHSNQGDLYSRFMALAEACLSELIQEHFKNKDYKVALIVFIHTNGRNGSYNPHLHVILAEGALLPRTQEWKPFKHLSLQRLRLLWQKHLLGLMESEFPTRQVVINALWNDYPDGFYTHPGNNKKDKVPSKSYRGLIQYLTKYLSSPPIGLSRIVDYDGENVRYYYQSHRTKLKTYETLDAQVFIGRMVQHILPKGFQKVRYYGLQATANFKKWYEVIAQAAGDLVDAMVSYAKRISYAEFFEEIAGLNPLTCVFCGRGMELVQLFHPKRGVFFDLLASSDGE